MRVASPVAPSCPIIHAKSAGGALPCLHLHLLKPEMDLLWLHSVETSLISLISPHLSPPFPPFHAHSFIVVQRIDVVDTDRPDLQVDTEEEAFV